MPGSANAEPSREAIREELSRVLSSAAFERSSNTGRLLQYLCQKYLDGEAENIKEYSIAIDVFGRASDFDTRRNSIVRVEVTRLRQRLERYYQSSESQDATLEILLPPGSYVPRFLPRRLGGDAPPERPRKKWLLAGVGGLLLITAVASPIFLRRGTNGAWAGSRPPARIAEASVSSSAASAGVIRILAGLERGAYVDRHGRVWQSDRFFSGGSPASPVKDFVSGTYDPALFHHARHGASFSYAIPLGPGVYELRLFFSENQYGPGLPLGGGEHSRWMDVAMNARPLLARFDVCADAGGDHIADIRVFKDVQPGPDGLLHLAFRGDPSNPGDAFLNAIEIVPGVPRTLHPIRLLARETWVTDQQERTWTPDDYYRGGRLRDDVLMTQGSERELHRAERWGNFSYVIPVAPGSYTVNLHFSETYYREPGRRVFHVFSEGTMLLRNFDILREAGGPTVGLTRSFHGLMPNAQGKIVLSFVPVVDFASVNAIEVIDEAR